MTDFNRTLLYAGVAIVLGLGALLTSGGTSPAEIDGFSDVGKVLFEGFDDPVDATTLEVVAWNEEEKAPQVFGVQLKDEKWVLSSHNDYPAEAADRLARTAASLIGIERSAVKSRREDDWSKFGVLDPSDEDSALIADVSEDEKDQQDTDDVSDTGPKYGTRITLRDSDTNALVDLIVGNQVPNQTDFRYVRIPGEKTTFISKLNIDLSAKFEDWIEDDLLQVQQNKIVQLKINNYSIDEASRTIEQGDIVEAQKKELDSTGEWTLIGLKEQSEEFDNSPITSITSNLASLKIKGVRRKSKGINPDLTLDPSVSQDQFTMLRLQSELQAQGYFIVPDKNDDVRLASNEGELIAGTDDGVQYTLYFGEVATGSSRDIEVGQLKSEETEDNQELNSDKGNQDKPADKDESQADQDESTNTPEVGSRRYVLIKVEFDESLLGPELIEPKKPEKPDILKQAEAEAAKKEKEENKSKDADASDKPTETSTQAGDCDFQEEDADTSAETGQNDESQDGSKTVADSKEPDKKTADVAPTDEQTTVEPTPAELAKIAYDAALATYREEKQAYDSQVAIRSRKRSDGKQTVEKLKKRFSDWYYVITANDFEKFRVERKDLVSLKETPVEDATDSQ